MDPLLATRWGIPSEVVNGLGTRLHQVWKRYQSYFKTCTRDTSDLAHVHLRGQLTMDRRRNFAQIDARLQQGDGQPLQLFTPHLPVGSGVSNSPWLSRSVFAQLQAKVRDTPGLEDGSVLILDERPDEKAGPHSAEAGRQHNGRLGKIGLCHVVTCLNYANPALGLWTLLDGELFLPAAWFCDAYAERRKQVGVPVEQFFETKPAMGLKTLAPAAGQV